MKKIFLLYFLLISFLSKGVSQKSYTLKGVVLSQISQLPIFDTARFRIRIKGNTTRYIYLNQNAEFEIKQLKKGRYEITLQESNEAGEFYNFKDIDTIIILSKNLITHFKLFNKDIKECDEWKIDKQKALEDIAKGKSQLYLPPTGISGDMNLTPDDLGFEKKYNIKYQATGCSFPNFECFRIYNLTMFDYLDKKFNKSWRNGARADILFLK